MSDADIMLHTHRALTAAGLETELENTGGGIYVIYARYPRNPRVTIGISVSEERDDRLLVCDYDPDDPEDEGDTINPIMQLDQLIRLLTELASTQDQ